MGELSYGAFAYYYDQLMDDMPYPEWLDYIEAIWQEHGLQPQTVVDLGCGTGNIAIPLALRGYEVIGIDLSADMLAVARHKQEQLSVSRPNVNWVESNMTQWQWPHTVDAVISLCDSMNYLLEENEVLQTFRQTYDGLSSGGIFIFDVHTHYTFKSYAEEQPFTWNEEDIAYIWHCYLDDHNYEIEHELTIFVKDAPLRITEQITDGPRNAGEEPQANQDCFRRIDELHRQRAYSLKWLNDSLYETGFHDVACLADFMMKPADETTKRAFFIARKR